MSVEKELTQLLVSYIVEMINVAEIPTDYVLDALLSVKMNIFASELSIYKNDEEKMKYLITLKQILEGETKHIMTRLTNFYEKSKTTYGSSDPVNIEPKHQ